LSDEETKKVVMRSSVYLTAVLETFNKVLAERELDEKNAAKEATAVMKALFDITISIVSSLGGEKAKTFSILSQHIEMLDQYLVDLDGTDEVSYLASPDVPDLPTSEVREIESEPQPTV